MQTFPVIVREMDSGNPYFATKEALYRDIDKIAERMQVEVRRRVADIEEIDSYNALTFLSGNTGTVKVQNRKKKIISFPNHELPVIQRAAYEVLGRWINDPMEGRALLGGFYDPVNYFADWIETFDNVTIEFNETHVLTLYPHRPIDNATMIIVDSASWAGDNVMIVISRKKEGQRTDMTARKQNYHMDACLRFSTIREFCSMHKVERADLSIPENAMYIFSMEFGKRRYIVPITAGYRRKNKMLFGGDTFVWNINHCMFFTSDALIDRLFTSH